MATTNVSIRMDSDLKAQADDQIRMNMHIPLSQ